MSEKIKVCSNDELNIKGYVFRKEKLPPVCPLEQKIPENAYCCPIDGANLYAIPSEIGISPHPLLYFFEAAIYTEGAWVVGIDTKQNRYFTPIF